MSLCSLARFLSSLVHFVVFNPQVVNHMRYATQMEKGDPNLVAVATKTKQEMNDFVSSYRRSTGNKTSKFKHIH